MSSRLRVSLHAGWMAAALLAAICLGGLAQGNQPRPTMIQGELIIGVRHGTPAGDVQALAATVNATVVKAFGVVDAAGLEDAYWLRIPGKPLDADTMKAAATLKNDPRVMFAGPNGVCYPTQISGGVTPNDPRFPEQWDKTLIRMPLAWTLEKGEANVVAVDIDTGTDIDHPDIAPRFYKGFNATLGTNDPRDILPTTNPDHGHGTHTAGIIAAATNNGIGVAGTTWQNVKLMPINASDASAGLPTTSIMAALQFMQTDMGANPNFKYVVNMSFGGAVATDTPDPTDPASALILNLATQGVVFSISAGNSFDQGNPPSWPALLAQSDPRIFCVASCGPQGEHSFYSEARSYTTIAAPGGNDPSFSNPSLQILSTFPLDAGSYAFEQGTSMAAPQITGVAALIAGVPGVTTDKIKGIITGTARPGVGQTAFPDQQYGYGVVDAYAALLKVALAVAIQTPQGSHPGVGSGGSAPAPEETLQPEIRVTVAQFTPDQIAITADGSSSAIRQGTPTECTPDHVYLPGIADNKPFYCIENVKATLTDQKGNPVLDANGNPIPLTYDAVIRNLQLSPGQHSISVIGTKPAVGNNPPVTKNDSVTFSIVPHVVPIGRTMLSIPYFQQVGVSPTSAVTPEQYFGTGFRLARWVPGEERYAFYGSSGPKDPDASFAPPVSPTDLPAAPHADGDPTPRYPLGLGYWADITSETPILTRGHALTDQAFVIPLVGNGSGNANFISWNMVGDPFPFDVPFNAVLVDTPQGRMSITDAVQKGYLLPNIYTYDGTTGYTFQTLPSGAFRAWTSHWIGVTSRDSISLVVPPAGSAASRAASRAASQSATRAVPPPPATPGGWHLQIGAHVRDLHDTFNFIGTSTRAADGYNAADVAKPPMPSPYVSVGTTHSDWGAHSGLYAQDLQSPGGVKTWNIAVATDQTSSDVTLSWSTASIPRNVKLSVKDEATGQVVDMRMRSSITFNSGTDAATRKYTITAKTGVAGPVRISNLNVRGASRAAGTSIIGFTLSTDATYDVKVLSSTGATVTSLATRAAGTGDVSVVWNGRDIGGKAVPSGTYLVQVRATTADGDSVRALMPFTVVR